MKCKFNSQPERNTPTRHYNLHVVAQTITIDFAGSRSSYKIIDAKPGIEFDVVRVEEFDDHYTIVVYDDTAKYKDHGGIEQLINIPKSLVTITGRPSKIIVE